MEADKVLSAEGKDQMHSTMQYESSTALPIVEYLEPVTMLDEIIQQAEALSFFDAIITETIDCYGDQVAEAPERKKRRFVLCDVCEQKDCYRSHWVDEY